MPFKILKLNLLRIENASRDAGHEFLFTADRNAEWYVHIEK